jgi:arylsulfatase A-like enzyme
LCQKPFSKARRVEREPDERLNIVLFYEDDWTAKTLGLLNGKVLTLNLDTMAKRGMAFTRNCITTTVCWMSRATKVTGLYTSVHQRLGIWGRNRRSMFDEVVAWNDTLYAKLFAAGYNGYLTNGLRQCLLPIKSAP